MMRTGCRRERGLGRGREWRGRAVAGAEARLPVGGVDTRDSDADSDLARLRVRYIAIDESENRWVTSARVNDRPHGLDNPSASSIIPDSIGVAPYEVHTSTTCGPSGVVMPSGGPDSASWSGADRLLVCGRAQCACG